MTISEHSDNDALRAQLDSAMAEIDAGTLDAAATLLRRVFEASRPAGQPTDTSRGRLHLDAGLRLGEVLESLERLEEVADVYASVRLVARGVGDGILELWANLKLVAHYLQAGELDTAVSFVAPMRPLLHLAADDASDDQPAPVEGIPAPRLADVHGLLFELCDRVYYAENYDAAEMIARLILERDHEYVPALTYLGYIQLRREDDGALDTWQRAATVAPDIAFMHTNLAAAYVNAGDLEQAVDAVSRSIELEPNNPLTWRARANYYQGLGENELALADLGSIIRLADEADPVAPETPQARSQAEYERTMSLRDQADLASLSRVILLREMGRVGDAKDAARHLIDVRDPPTVAAAARLLAGMQVDEGDIDAAVEAVDRAVVANPERLDLLLDRARLYMTGERYPEATADLDAASSAEEQAGEAIPLLLELAAKSPPPPGVDRALGHAYLAVWHPAKAHAHLMKAAEQGPLDAMALYWRALSVITFGDQDDPEEEQWTSSLSGQKITAVIEDLAVAHQLAATDEIVQALCWVVERAVQISDIMTWLAHLSYQGKIDPPFSSWPGFALVADLYAGANLGSARRWAEAVEALAGVRARALAAGLPLMAALADVFAADSYLRLYELQRADDLLTRGQAAMRHFSTPLAQELREQSAQQLDEGDHSGVQVVAMDYDHLSFVLITRTALQETIDPLRAQLASRTGDSVQVAAHMQSMKPVSDLIAQFRENRIEPRELTVQATLLRDVDRFDEALELADAVAADAYGDNDRLTALNIGATVLMQTRQLDGAASRLEEALELAERVVPHAMITIAANLASVEALRGDHAAAIALMDAHPLPHDVPYPQAFGRRAQRGISLQRLDRSDEALTELLAAVDLHESVRATLRSPEDRIAWQSQADRVSLYAESILAAISADQPATAFTLVERSKARSFVDQLANGPLPTDESMQQRQEILTRVRDRLRLLDQLSAGVAGFVDHEAVKRLIRLGGDDPRTTRPDGSVDLDPDRLSRSKELAQAAAERLEAEIDEIRYALVEGVVGEVASIDSLSDLLRRESEGKDGQVVLVEYYVASFWSAVFVLRGNANLKVELLEGDESLWVELAETTFSGLEDALATDIEGWAESVAPLVDPIVEHTKPGDLVWLVPYGPLHYLPLHAAIVGEEWLVERNPVVYSPSASVLPYCLERRSPREGRALVLGDSRGDLVHARHEAELVAAQLGTHALVTGEARRSAVLQQLNEPSGFGIAHFACHGFFDSNEPFRSGLLMAPGDAPGEDVLTVKDLNDIRLDADLVTLSACQSGVSAHRSGDELIGLSRSILHSGASSVMVSLWTVDDYSTALLMEEFYALLLTAAPDRASAWAKPLALRQAQLALMDRTATEVAVGLRARIALSLPEAAAAALELDLAEVHALAGDLDGALDQCALALEHASGSSIGLRITAYAEGLRFDKAVQERQGDAEPVDWTVPVFAHPAHWAGFVMVGDWRSTG